MANVLVAVIAPLIVAVVTIALYESPRRARLAAANLLHRLARRKPQTSEDKFIVAVCWLKGDTQGIDMDNVARSITDRHDLFALVRSARTVAIPDSPDDRSRIMGERCRRVFRSFNADLVIVGSVARPNETLELWVEPRLGRSPNDLSDGLFVLDEQVRLSEEFRKYLDQSVLALALAAAAPAANTDSRRDHLYQELRQLTTKFTAFVQADTTLDRASVYDVLGEAHLALFVQEQSIQLGEAAVNVLGAAVAAHEECAKGVPSMKWARAQLKRGAMLYMLGTIVTETDRYQDAINALNLAMQVFAREKDQSLLRTTREFLAAASVSLAQRLPGEHLLEEAVDHLKDLLEETSTENKSSERPMYNRLFADALMDLYGRTSAPEALYQALDVYEHAAASDERMARKDASYRYSYAETLSNLSAALKEVALLEASEERLSEAEKVCRAAVKGAEGSATLGAALGNLGNILLAFWQLDPDAKYIFECIAVYQAALLEFDPEERTVDWAATQANLATAYVNLAMVDRRTDRLELIESAVDARRAALSVYSPERSPYEWVYHMLNLGRVLRVLGAEPNRSECASEAVQILRDAIAEISRENEPHQWIEAHWELGKALMILAQNSTLPERFREAIDVFRTALEEIKRREPPDLRASARMEIGDALARFGEAGNEKGCLLEARTEWLRALEELDEDTNSAELRQEIEQRLAQPGSQLA